MNLFHSPTFTPSPSIPLFRHPAIDGRRCSDVNELMVGSDRTEAKIQPTIFLEGCSLEKSVYPVCSSYSRSTTSSAVGIFLVILLTPSYVLVSEDGISTDFCEDSRRRWRRLGMMVMRLDYTGPSLPLLSTRRPLRPCSQVLPREPNFYDEFPIFRSPRSHVQTTH